MHERPDYPQVTQWLAPRAALAVFSHRRPDGDALGSIAGMTLALRALGKVAVPVLYEPAPARYAAINGMTDWRLWPDAAPQVQACDGVVILDTCSFQQLEPIVGFLPGAPPILVIDHHATRDEIGVRPGDLRLFDESAGAASLIVAEWARVAGVPFTPDLARALFTGIATDSGWFRFSNTDARMLRMAADLVATGVSPPDVNGELYQQDSPARLRLAARALTSLELLAHGQLAVMKLRRADYAAAGAGPADSEDLVNEAGRLAGIEAILLFNEEPDGRVRANLRSRKWLDVAKLAAEFGGGGHARAAGARLAGDFEAVCGQIVARTVGALGASS